MTDQNDQEMSSSDLGTLDYWERVYSEELNNFKDHGDVGEIWFGRNNSLKVIRWITTHLNLNKKDDKIIDIGCGNGMTLVELSKDFTKLMGIDYSEKAIDLTREILKKNNLFHIDLKVYNIVDSEECDLLRDFKVAHDKGTYDAISLHPQDPATKREKYIENVYKILLPDGYLVLTSCNWTKEELTNHFKNYFNVVNVLPPSDTFQFGGQIGNTVTQLILQKKQ